MSTKEKVLRAASHYYLGQSSTNHNLLLLKLKWGSGAWEKALPEMAAVQNIVLFLTFPGWICLQDTGYIPSSSKVVFIYKSVSLVFRLVQENVRVQSSLLSPLATSLSFIPLGQKWERHFS